MYIVSSSSLCVFTPFLALTNSPDFKNPWQTFNRETTHSCHRLPLKTVRENKTPWTVSFPGGTVFTLITYCATILYICISLLHTFVGSFLLWCVNSSVLHLCDSSGGCFLFHSVQYRLLLYTIPPPLFLCFLFRFDSFLFFVLFWPLLRSVFKNKSVLRKARVCLLTNVCMAALLKGRLWTGASRQSSTEVSIECQAVSEMRCSALIN